MLCNTFVVWNSDSEPNDFVIYLQTWAAELGILTVDNPQCRNLAIFLPLWFYVKSILVDFKRTKKSRFNNFEGFEFWFLEKFPTWKCQKFPKNSKFIAAQMVKMAVFGGSKWPKLISRKFWVAEISWNFHMVYYQFGCPGLYWIDRGYQFYYYKIGRYT